MPKISIIIAAYNAEKYLPQCLDSVLGQTMDDYEVVVVDDGSSDSTPLILAQYAARDARIVAVRQGNSGKPAVARNAGIRRSSGRYVTFLDADDLYEPNRLRRESELLDRFEQIDLVFCDMFLASESGITCEKTYLHHSGVRSQARCLGGNDYLCPKEFYNFMSSACTSLSTQTVMVRRSRLLREEVWFPEDMSIGEDIDLWFRLVKGSEILFIDEPLACYRKHGTSITADVERFYLGSVMAHAANHARAMTVLTADERKTLELRIAKDLFHLGYHYKQAGRYRESRRAYLDSLSWKFSARTGFALAKSCLCSAIGVL